MGNIRRLKKIVITGLFDMFYHNISLNMDDRITIIHGPNGFGKTTILMLIDLLFDKRFITISRIPFDRFEIYFDDDSTLKVEKETIEKTKLEIEKKLNSLNFTFLETSRNPQNWIFQPEKDIYGDKFYEESPFLSTLRNQMVHAPDKTNIEQIYSDYLYNTLNYFMELESKEKGKKIQTPVWLNEILEGIPIYFIQSQRLLYLDPTQRKYQERSYVNIYSEDLAKEIKSIIVDAQALSQKLDRTFPVRLVKMITTKDQEKIPSPDVISENLRNLEEKRSQLIEVGLIDSEEVIVQPPEAGLSEEHTRQVLDLHIKDGEKKLEILTNFGKKLRILKEILNTRFQYKELIINRENGFLFRIPDKNVFLKPDLLSSGEQHQLVVFYRLLFKAKPGSLILIDEPEISLHVAWQQFFLKDIQKIAKIADLDIIIATHSPQIIHDRWDLTVELKSPS